MARPKKPKKILWSGYTEHEQRTMALFHAAFGTVTHVSKERFDRPWAPVAAATWERCPNCMTWWDPEYWPVCQFCRFRDRGPYFPYD